MQATSGGQIAQQVAKRGQESPGNPRANGGKSVGNGEKNPGLIRPRPVLGMRGARRPNGVRLVDPCCLAKIRRLSQKSFTNCIFRSYQNYLQE